MKADMTMAFVVIMILMLVIIAALLYPQYNIFAKISERTPYDVCRQSVEASSLMRVSNVELAPFLKCQTQQYTITTNNADEAKKTIADAMYYCHYQFAQGEKNLFDSEGTFCFVCSTIDFEDKGKQLKELPAFFKYLYENYATAKNTYAQYLYKFKDFKKEKQSIEKTTAYLEPLKTGKLGVLFIYKKFKSTTQLESEKAIQSWLEPISKYAVFSPLIIRGGASGASEGVKLGGKIFGDYTYNGYVFVVNPYSAEKLKSFDCTIKIPQKAA